MESYLYHATTDGIEVMVEPRYQPEHSRPGNSPAQHVYSYKVTIKNSSLRRVQLLTRHWIITDGNGQIHEVKGEGVIGLQPTIAPGESHQYESFCPLPTPTGNMRGSYKMSDDSGLLFDVAIPLFFLRSDVLH
jgi:ApaG protein